MKTALIAILLGACSSTPQPGPPPSSSSNAVTPGGIADSAALPTPAIRRAQAYRDESDAQFTQVTTAPRPKNTLCAASFVHPREHGELARVFVRRDPNGYLAGRALPEDEAIEKRVFVVDADGHERITGYFSMFKAPGENAAGGGWLYATADADGKVREAGVLQSCVSCHDGKRDRDFVFGLGGSTPLDRPRWPIPAARHGGRSRAP